jgi:hypothetical protein
MIGVISGINISFIFQQNIRYFNVTHFTSLKQNDFNFAHFSVISLLPAHNAVPPSFPLTSTCASCSSKRLTIST